MTGKQWMAGFVGLAAGVAAMAAIGSGGGTPGKADRAMIEQVVREYILAHPEIIPEAMARLQRNEVGKVVSASRAALETPYPGAVAGAADADVTLVEFFDYACGYCRQTVADIDRLLAEDRKLRVVFRELPILGPGSEEAARASLAAAGQGRFLAFHRAMFAAGRPAAATIASALKTSGVAPGAAPAATASAEIDRNIELARTLNVTGTPSFVIGDQMLNGAVGYDALKKAIAEARAAKKG